MSSTSGNNYLIALEPIRLLVKKDNVKDKKQFFLHFFKMS